MLIIEWVITVRHFDNIIGLRKINNPVADSHFMKFLFRAGQYATLIVFCKGMKKSYDHRIFGEFDFRAHARTVDKVLSFGFCILSYGGLGIALLAGFAQFSMRALFL